MKRFSLFGRIKNISIAKKLYFTVGIMAMLIAVELAVLIFSINTLSSVRAYVAGEGLWSKAQKDAMYQLLKYSRTRNENDYEKFISFMQVSAGDHAALVELAQPKPDLSLAKKGFIRGRNDENDVDGMIKLFSRFHAIYYINKAIVVWTKADSLVAGFVPIGKDLHQEINKKNASLENINNILARIDPINAQLTGLEDEFSFTLGEGSRWLERMVLKLLFGVALTVECTGLILAIAVSRGIQKGLSEILQSAQSVARRDFSRTAKVFSKDEIGILANNFNAMSGELERMEKQIMDINTGLEKEVKLRTLELERKNKELEQFAYVASHDLQEPLRTTTGFAELIKEKYLGKLDSEADTYIMYIIQSADRMKVLIKDLLDYSRIGRETEIKKIDCNEVLHEVISDLNGSIREGQAEIIAENLPVITGYPMEIKQLFQNLISNAIKFRKKNIAPQITINAEMKENAWQFSFRDNGIGIEEKYQSRIFIIFQRLHTRSEYDGSGIGLAHCKKIVDLHEGKIWVESTAGNGSNFKFTIHEHDHT
jgi:signal transduction histidine kinase